MEFEKNHLEIEGNSTRNLKEKQREFFTRACIETARVKMFKIHTNNLIKRYLISDVLKRAVNDIVFLRQLP